jgi:arginyl-tRNA synthetase
LSAPTPRQAVAAWAQPVVDGYLVDLDPAQRPPVRVERPARPEHGDLALSLPLQLARPLGRNPLQVAEELAAKLSPGGPVATVEVAPPGFINLRLDPHWLFQALGGVIDDPAGWGRAGFGAGRRVQVEFVSTNPTGPLLVSHGRGAVVGDTIARLLSFSGHDVEREFYVNDAGRQIELFGRSILAATRGELPPEGGYTGEYIKELAAQVPTDILEGPADQAEARVTEWGIRYYLDEFRADLDAIDIHFDRWFNERELYVGDWEAETLAALEKSGHTSRHDGATWLVLPDGTEAVLYKSTNERTYLWGDLLYHRDKLVRRAFDRAIDIWGADHQNQERRVKQALQLIGVDSERLAIVLIQLVHVRDEHGLIKLSKRRGNVVALRDLVDTLGPDPVRFFYLLRSADVAMDFDIDLARRQSNENPVFYAQYAHARLSSVRAVAEEAGIAPDPAGLDRLGTPGEVELAFELLEFPDVVEQAARALEPHQLPHYAQRLAEKVHTFYHAGNLDSTLRVVVEDRALSGARLLLCEAARTTIANALGLMGVTTPERM